MKWKNMKVLEFKKKKERKKFKIEEANDDYGIRSKALQEKFGIVASSIYSCCYLWL